MLESLMKKLMKRAPHDNLKHCITWLVFRAELHSEAASGQSFVFNSMIVVVEL